MVTAPILDVICCHVTCAVIEGVATAAPNPTDMANPVGLIVISAKGTTVPRLTLTPIPSGLTIIPETTPAFPTAEVID